MLKPEANPMMGQEGQPSDARRALEGGPSGAPNALEKALIQFGDDTYREFSQYRFAEEREWYEQALFYQRRQWLKWNDSTRRWTLVKQNPQQPKPMPVSNYFAMTINANANQINGSPVQITAMPNDEDSANRRSAEFAEKAVRAIDQETGYDILKPLLAKHMTIWGMGVTKDLYDSGLVNGRTKVPQFDEVSTRMISCVDCGGNYEVLADSTSHRTGAGAVDNLPDGTSPELPAETALACPQCGSHTVTEYPKKSLTVKEVTYFNKGKLTTEVRPIFEIYLPRDCQNANLAKRVMQRYRKPLSVLRRLYGEKAKDILADTATETHEIYLEALRSLVNYNHLHENKNGMVTITELWASWDEMPKDLQEKLEAEFQQDTEKLETIQEEGLYLVYAGGKMLDWGANYMEGETPYTFFLWEVDPANVYPKGQSVDLVPLQKRLNRIDSLIELAMMCNAAGKWLWPKTQTTKPPSGSPNELIEYDPQGDAKFKPEFVLPKPFASDVWQFRQTILQDFQRLGNTMGVGQGQMPAGGGNKAFRALAYLGAKADEQFGTQRYLWELAHKLRYEKCLILARKFWDEPRKVKVAGFNGRYAMQQFMGKDLEGDYSLDFEANSSRPRSFEEKTATFASLLEAGMVDPMDSAVREYITDLANLEGVNLTDHLQYQKAERDLESLKRGEMPIPSPFTRPDILFKVFSNFALTEEFEQLDPMAQQAIQGAAQMAQQALAVQMAPPPEVMAEALGKALKGGKKEKGANPLSGVPGESVSPGAAEGAAVAEGANVASQLP